MWFSVEEDGDSSSLVSETEDSLLYLRSLFPVGAFDTSPHHRLPPIVLKHQLYALLTDRTLVDRQLVGFVTTSSYPFSRNHMIYFIISSSR
jgi:serine/threonine-protein kinase 19